VLDRRRAPVTLPLYRPVGADRALVPVTMQDEAAIAGMEQLLETLRTIQEQEADPVRLLAIVKNRVKLTSRAYRINSDALAPFEQADLPFASVELREAAAWHNAAADGLPLVLALPNSEAARNFRDLMVELWPDVQFPYMSELAIAWRRRREAGVA
jgi:cellulose biosynthesis protein BcsQ